MTLTLLFDLDDTLLKNDIDTFLPAYLKLLGKHMQSFVAPEKMVRELLTATGKMVSNNNAAFSLEQAFDSAFYAAIGHSKADLRATLEQFYDDVYPGLQPLTGVIPGAAEVVEQAANKGHTLVIATNPLFPRKAILHRLRWADMAPEHTPFSLISDFETFHFAKISKSYYPEFLLNLGWNAEPVLMIGDSLERDIFPAQKAGLPVFWLRSSEQVTPEADSIPQGTFEDLRRWIEEADCSTLVPNFANPEALLVALPASLAVLHSLTLRTPAAQWTVRPASGEWALTEILCHLRDVEREVNLPRFQTALKDENAFIAGQDTDPWAEQRDYIHQDGLQAFQDYAAARLQLISLLKTLRPEQWDRKVRHTIFGPTTLHELASFMLEHDQSHVRQALATIKRL